ncbi:hypothetical protein C943_04158 [Mariniradius saccharolyticus AK6]|uniref:Lipoprotein n=1 Tax=Mariniradius saccharolyticus AK6 TaxID=1239962 RepID=M7XG84_9BACT|nr:hypothetical protein [Mariniradius saccharolyticus]EMS33839.1 hypothetical protein C943_04158 [Mariniradius saccharolyticus AK6]
MKFNHLILLLGVLMTSCFVKPRLTNSKQGKYAINNRYKAPIDSPTIDNIFELNVGILPIPPTTVPVAERPKTFFDLRDSIPHVYLKIIGEKTGDSIPLFLEAIKAELSKPGPPRPGPTSIDAISDKVTVRLLISTVKRLYNDPELLHDNKRLDYLHTKISIKGTNFKIYSIDKLENEFETIDLGTLSRKTDVTFETGLTGEIGKEISVARTNSDNSNSDVLSSGTDTVTLYDSDGNPVKVTSNSSKTNTTGGRSNNTDVKAGAKASVKAEMNMIAKQTLEEAANLKQKRAKTTFSFNQESLTVSQRGALLRDISDNVFVTLTLTHDKTAKVTKANSFALFMDLYDKEGKVNLPKSIGYEVERKQYFPCGTNSLALNYEFEGVIRGIMNKRIGNNAGEFDDKVVYFPIEGKPKSISIDLDDFCTRVYEFVMTSGKEEYTLYNGGQKVYIDEKMAYEFLIWFYEALNTKDISFFNQNLKNGSAYSFELYKSSSEKIELFRASFSEDDHEKLANGSFRIRPIN